MKNTLVFAALLAVGLLLLGGCAMEPAKKTAEWPAMPGYEAMKIPESNPISDIQVELGKQLYYDTRLSGDGERSCYGCHLAEKGLTDGRATALGAFDKQLTRSSPTMWNVGYYPSLYWDGRSTALEKQVKGAWSGGNMGASGKDGAPSMEDICAKLDEIEGYRYQFHNLYHDTCSPDFVARSIASFMRTIVANDSAWARFRSGDESAFNEEARRGYEIFKGKARCTNCHDGALLTDMQFHNTGIGMEKKGFDVGRYKVTNEEKDKGAFKTPSLFDISKSAPYFHDGSVATLEEAVDLMLRGGLDNQWLDEANLRPAIELTTEERDDLLAFLRALDVNYNIEAPTLPE
jgi:cytochrome c peroxidase